MPVPLLVPVLAGLAAALVADGADEEDPPEGDYPDREPWSFLIDDDLWIDLGQTASRKVGWVEVNFEDRTVIGAKGLEPVHGGGGRGGRVVFSTFRAPLHGLGVRDWFEERESELEDLRGPDGDYHDRLVEPLLAEFREALREEEFSRIYTPEAALAHWVAIAGRTEVVRELISTPLRPIDILDRSQGGIVVHGTPAEAWGAVSEVLTEWAEGWVEVTNAEVVDADPEGLLQLMGGTAWRLQIWPLADLSAVHINVLAANIMFELRNIPVVVDTDEEGRPMLQIELAWPGVE